MVVLKTALWYDGEAAAQYCSLVTVVDFVLGDLCIYFEQPGMVKIGKGSSQKRGGMEIVVLQNKTLYLSPHKEVVKGQL